MSRPIARGACCAFLSMLMLPGSASAVFGDRPLRMGTHGRDVRVLQSLLTRVRFPAVVDGAFGRGTRRAVGSWERARERRIDGWLSRADARVLRSEFKRPASAPQPRADAMLFGARRRPTLTAALTAAGTVTAEVLGAAGTVVTAFSRRVAAPGEVELRWNGRIGRKPAPEGFYALRLADAAGRASASTSTPAGAFAFRHHRFPIAGEHDLGQSETNGFGGGRGHQGQDMFARCGTPVLAAQGGVVRFSAYHAAAGYYAVIRGAASGEDYVYMHLREAPALRRGDRVATGARVGAVGQTGRASGCHLHFELWSKPGWYAGGKAYDPLPKLRAWDRWS